MKRDTKDVVDVKTCPFCGQPMNSRNLAGELFRCLDEEIQITKLFCKNIIVDEERVADAEDIV